MKQLTNEKEYRAVIKRIDELLEVVTDENYYSAPEAVELDILSDLVEDYENRNCPITTPSLADVLRLRMNELNINQTSLANMLNVSPSRISEYLAGKEPSLRVAGLMYEKLGVSAKVIFGINDTIHVSEPEFVA